MTRVMGSTPEGYIANSPMHLIEKHADLFATSEDTLDLWPRILFLHGQKDATVSMDQSAHMFNAIGKVLPMKCRDEVDVRMRFYKRMNHGEPVTGKELVCERQRIGTNVCVCVYSVNARHVCKKEPTKIAD